MMLSPGSRVRSSRSKSQSKASLIAALDVGTSKVTCLIARLDNQLGSIHPRPEVIGFGQHISDGVKGGTVIGMDSAEQAIRHAVETAERMAQVEVKRVLASITGGQPQSHKVHVEIDLAGNAVSDQDVRRIINHGRHTVDFPDRDVLHARPVGFSLDGCRGIRDPREMFGERLGVDLHFVTTASGPLRNLLVCIERSHIDVAAPIYGAYASGLACLVQDELDLGVTLIDMGAGSTSIAVFAEGELQFTGVVPIGGQHVTKDIARGLSTPLDHAERMKTLFGSVLSGSRDDKEMIEFTQIGEGTLSGKTNVPRSMLTQIIRARLEETFEHVRDLLKDSGYDSVAGRRVVLTGGASELNGVRELAGEILGKQVRLGVPISVDGGSEGIKSPAFSSAVGLILYGCQSAQDGVIGESDLLNAGHAGAGMTPGWLNWIPRWLNENF